MGPRDLMSRRQRFTEVVMSFRNAATISLLVLVVVSCATMKSDSGLGQAKVQIVKPEIEIRQLSVVPIAARHSQGPLPVKYELRVANRSDETITLKRISVQSMGVGAYTVNPQSHPFDKKIVPGGYEVVQFWIPTVVDDETIIGANGPVTLRGVVHFDSTVGQFDEVFVQQVNPLSGREPKAQ